MKPNKSRSKYVCLGGRKTREERNICLKIRLFGFPQRLVMGSATTAARKVVSSSTLIGPFKILARAQIQQPLELPLKFKPVLRAVSHVTKNVSACVTGNSSEAGRGLSPVVSFCLVVRDLCLKGTSFHT